MTTTIEPPQAPPTPPVPGGSGPTPPPASRGSSKVVAILVACFGGLVVVGAVASAVFGAVGASLAHSATLTADADGVAELRADVSATSLDIVFADVDEAELEVRGATGADRWSLDREGDTLTLSSPQGWFGGGWWPFGRAGEAVLTLPRELDGLSADLVLSAGDFTAEGSFDTLGLELNAGRADITGDARTVDADVNAGRVDLELARVAEASLTVSAGELNTTFTGTQPDALTLDVSAGSLNATVPEGEYDVTSDVSAGGFDNRIDATPDASSTIDVQVSAGQVTLRAG